MNNTSNRVFNKIIRETKIELATQKVELGVIDEADSLISKANGKSLEASKFVQNAQRSYAEASDLSSRAETILSKALPQAKDLGAKQLVKQIQSFLKGTSNRIKRFNKNESTLKSIN